jgi:hypothetical protein
MTWCKERALQYCDSGNMQDAIASIMSDLKKHPETENHVGIQLGLMSLMSGKLSTAGEVRKFIEGFN